MSKPVPKPLPKSVPMAADIPVDCATGLSGGPFEPAGATRDRAGSGRRAASDIINCDGRLWALLHQDADQETDYEAA